MMNDNQNNLFAKLAFGDLNEVEALLKNGVNLDEHKNHRGETALNTTLFMGDMKRAELLLKNNASPNIKDNNGETILHALIRHNSIEKIKFLLQNTPDINLEVKNNWGYTSLYSAIHNGNIKTTALLLKYKADPNTKDNYGYTPLYSNNIKAAELLLKYGANPNVENDTKFTPLDSAIANQHKELAELLLKNGASVIVGYTKAHLLSHTITQLLNMNVSEEAIITSLLTANSYSNTLYLKFRAISDELRFTKDVHRKVIDNHFKNAITELRKNGVTEENLHNNKFRDIIKTYKKYKDFAIDYREKSGSPCEVFEDYNTQSAEGLIIPKPSEFAEEVEALYDTHHKVNNLSYLAFKKLVSSHYNLDITQDNNITLYAPIKVKDTQTEQQLNIICNIKNQEIETVLEAVNLTEIIWDDNSSGSILSNLFEAELTGDIV